MTLSKPLTHSSFLIYTQAKHHKSVSHNTRDSLEVGYSSAKSLKAGGEGLVVEEIPTGRKEFDSDCETEMMVSYSHHSVPYPLCFNNDMEQAYHSFIIPHFHSGNTSHIS